MIFITRDKSWYAINLAIQLINTKSINVQAITFYKNLIVIGFLP